MQKAGMKDRMGSTLKPQERVLAFVSALQLRHAPGASGSREWLHPHYPGVPAQGSSEPSVGSPDFHLPSSVSSPISYFSCLTPLPTPGFPFQMSPATLEPGFPPCFPVPAEATGTLRR